MMKLMIIILSAIFFLGSLNYTKNSISAADGEESLKETIINNGKNITKTVVLVEDFTAVKFKGNALLKIEKADVNELTLQVEESFTEKIDIFEKNKTLIINFPETYRAAEPAQIVIKAKNINDILLNGNNNLTITNLSNSDEFKLESDGILTASMNIICKRLYIYTKSSAQINLSGKSDLLKFNGKGLAVLNAKSHTTTSCDFRVDGNTNSIVNVTEKLFVKINGIGIVNFIGDPIIEKKLSSTGFIFKYDPNNK